MRFFGTRRAEVIDPQDICQGFKSQLKFAISNLRESRSILQSRLSEVEESSEVARNFYSSEFSKMLSRFVYSIRQDIAVVNSNESIDKRTLETLVVVFRGKIALLEGISLSYSNLSKICDEGMDKTEIEQDALKFYAYMLNSPSLTESRKGKSEEFEESPEI